MEIKSKLKNRSGQELDVIYYEGTDPNHDLKGKILEAVHALCFYGNKIVIVYSKEKGYWSFPGGGIETGETWRQAIIREVKEETNMKVLHQKLIGFQDIYNLGNIIRQTRSFCIVEPYDNFVSDPDGDVTEIKLVDPKNLKEYFDWKEIGDRILERASEMLEEYNKSSR